MAKLPPLFLVILAAVFLCLPWIGEREFYTRGEPREAIVSQKMLETSNWILPRTFDDRVPSKPPFTHWMIGASAYLKSIVSGVVEVDLWAARFPAAILSLLFLSLFYVFIEKRLGASRALDTILILLTSFEWMRGMVSARVDTVLSVLIGVALLSLYSFSEKRQLLSLLAGILALTAAVLTKGPVALFLPAAVIGLYHLGKKSALSKIILVGVQFFIPALLLSSFWYYQAYQIGGDDFLTKFWYENVQRFASSTEDRPHDHSVFYLLLMLIVGMLPWSLLLFRPLYVFFKPAERWSRLKIWYRELNPLERYSLIVVVAFFIFFSIPSSKRGVYLLPSFPFFALLLSQLTSSLTAPKKELQIIKVGIMAVAVLCLAIFVLTLCHVDLLSNQLLHQNIRAQIIERPLSWIIVLLMLIYLPKLYSLSEPRNYFSKVALYLALCIIYIQGPVLNAFATTVGERRLAEQVASLKADLPLFSYEFEYYGTIFYLGQPVSLVGWKDAPHGIILVKERDFEKFQKEVGPETSLTILQKSQNPLLKLDEYVLIIEFAHT